MTIFGKVQSYMAAGKPIIGAINGCYFNSIKNNEVGYCVASEYCSALANLNTGLNLIEFKDIGVRAKEVYFAKYNKAIFMDKFICNLDEAKYMIYKKYRN